MIFIVLLIEFVVISLLIAFPVPILNGSDKKYIEIIVNKKKGWYDTILLSPKSKITFK